MFSFRKTFRNLTSFLFYAVPYARTLYLQWIALLYFVCIDEEVTVDYGLFTFGFERPFECCCGSASCRGKVRGEDWRLLAPEYGTHLHASVRSLISAECKSWPPGWGRAYPVANPHMCYVVARSCPPLKSTRAAHPSTALHSPNRTGLLCSSRPPMHAALQPFDLRLVWSFAGESD